MLGIYRVAAQLVASRVVLSSTELVSYKQLQTEHFKSLVPQICKKASYFNT
jgi:hypothetical protein